MDYLDKLGLVMQKPQEKQFAYYNVTKAALSPQNTMDSDGVHSQSEREIPTFDIIFRRKSSL